MVQARKTEAVASADVRHKPRNGNGQWFLFLAIFVLQIQIEIFGKFVRFGPFVMWMWVNWQKQVLEKCMKLLAKKATALIEIGTATEKL